MHFPDTHRCLSQKVKKWHTLQQSRAGRPYSKKLFCCGAIVFPLSFFKPLPSLTCNYPDIAITVLTWAAAWEIKVTKRTQAENAKKPQEVWPGEQLFQVQVWNMRSQRWGKWNSDPPKQDGINLKCMFIIVEGEKKEYWGSTAFLKSLHW